ncbi:PDZ domain-containing protein [Neorhodopirellula pilleata]|uniref:Serine endoprotease n=1 Tax=Neorhodopirellula pilleata TaxID=2714738 RepID=A0A5C5ZZU7_9BACT|nr:PDZ domain-containing protein [Neorhodopirellula pilleata]TWT92577.1 serine endoprotease [Neorhodopirellula pilleata]
MTCIETKRYGLPQIAWTLLIAMIMSMPSTRTWAQEDSPIPEWLQQRLVDRVLHRRDSNAMMRLMHPISQKVEGGIVEIISDGRPVALGTAVSSSSNLLAVSGTGSVGQDASVLQDAYVVTKRSELSGDPIRVRLSDGRLIPARVAAVRRRSDLALLVVQVDQATAARSLRPVRFESFTPLIGSFLVSPDRTGRVIGLGVMGASPRKVGSQGRLGIELEGIGQTTGARVRNIVPDSGADEAGLERGDRIIAIDGQNQSDLRQVVSTLNGMFPGEVVQLTIERDGSTVDIPARMSELTVLQESENDARVNGARNARLSGFEQAIQHDTVLNPEQCGGPILDTEGRVIGLNIARAGRVVSYALPASLVASEVSSMIAEAGGK